MGYAHEEFKYRLLDVENKKIIQSRDDTFFENQTADDVKKAEKPISLVDTPVNLDLILLPV